MSSGAVLRALAPLRRSGATGPKRWGAACRFVEVGEPMIVQGREEGPPLRPAETSANPPGTAAEDAHRPAMAVVFAAALHDALRHRPRSRGDRSPDAKSNQGPHNGDGSASTTVATRKSQVSCMPSSFRHASIRNIVLEGRFTVGRPASIHAAGQLRDWSFLDDAAP